VLRLGRRVRVPQSHRHLRARPARGDGERPPVAAFPVTGPIDAVAHGTSGILDDDLARAARQALRLAPADARRHPLHLSWAGSAKQFVSNIVDAAGEGLSLARSSPVLYRRAASPTGTTLDCRIVERLHCGGAELCSPNAAPHQMGLMAHARHAPMR
jgi:hypothetical protein